MCERCKEQAGRESGGSENLSLSRHERTEVEKRRQNV